jgi:hypothetical protein
MNEIWERVLASALMEIYKSKIECSAGQLHSNPPPENTETQIS